MLRWKGDPIPWLLALLLGCAPVTIADVGADAADAGVDVPVLRDAGTDANALRFGPCLGLPDGSVLQCATLEVPVDYEDPSLGTITLPVRRRPAANQGARLGALVWNPGGPGVAVYPTLPPVGVSDPVGTPGREVGDRFDLISMDWRGVGTSHPAIECDVERADIWARLSRYDLLEPMDAERTAQVIDDWVRVCVERYGAATLGRLGSRNAARDLDRLRAGLGEPALNFWGFSYGTALGATYATLFPERVRAFALDSISLFGQPTIEPAELVALEQRFDAFFVWCADHPASCAFADGRDAIELEAAWRALVVELDRYPSVIDGETVSGNTLRDRTAALRIDGRVAFPRLAVAFHDAERGDYAALVSMPSTPATAPDAFTAFTAVRASDDGNVGLDPSAVPDWLRRNLFAHSPRLGSIWTATTIVTLLWPVPPADGQPLSGPTTAPPMLVIGTTGDLATPYANAVSLVDQLANGSHLITYEGTEHAISGVDPCLRDIVHRFFLDPSAPPTSTRCVGVEP